MSLKKIFQACSPKGTYLTRIAVISFIIVVMGLSGCKEQSLTIKQILAQKIMLDIRYYCPDISKEALELDGGQCRTPVTKLPPEIAELISSSSLGSVILFAENLENIEQIVALTTDLQNAAMKSELGQPLFISVDQEGGRVVRLPRDIATSFTGNMSMGTAYKRYGREWAGTVGEVIGEELKALGINVNHAPNVDVNVNPNNPVINVRSFSDDPKVVAKLGISMLEGMQKQGVIATLKHFPGHGDTNVDSHKDLPVVHHDIETIQKVDIFPFQQAIANSDVKMIMTAHIQYPALDDSVVVNKFGEKMLRPATLSKVILTDMLRTQMGFKGLIVTDALDMAGISDFFTPLEAVLNTFEAGADIAMMPMKIRTKEDIQIFKSFLTKLALRVKDEPEMRAMIIESAERVIGLKSTVELMPKSHLSLSDKLAAAQSTLANSEHRKFEQELAEQGIIELFKTKNVEAKLLDAKNIHIVVPKQQQGEALASYFHKQLIEMELPVKRITISTYSTFHKNLDHYNASDTLILAEDGRQSVVINGGAEDLVKASEQSSQTKNSVYSLLKTAKLQGKSTILVNLNLPSKHNSDALFADWVITTFDGSTYFDRQTKELKSPVLKALAEKMLAQAKSISRSKV